MINIAEFFNNNKKYFKDLVTLAIPILTGHIAHTLINIGDILVAGRHSTLALAAISVASAIFMTFSIVGIGLIISVSPVVANLRGKREDSKSLIRPTLLYSFVIGIIIFLLTRLSAYFVPHIELADNLGPYVIEYLNITSWSAFGICIFVGLKEFLQAYEVVKFPNLLAVISIFANLIFNIIFVFGFLFVPAFGIKGLAYATTTVRIGQALILLLYCTPYLKLHLRRQKGFMKDLLKVGWPIALASFIEFLGFNITAVLAGKFSAVLSAAHNIIITFAGATYSVPLSIASALAVKIGFARGERNYLDIVKYYRAGIIFIILFMSTMSVFYLVTSEHIIKLFTPDTEVVQATIPVMALFAFFLVFDGLQGISGGALRGIKKTKPIMFSMLFAFLFIGIPVGCTLAFKYGIVLKGFWIGLALALCSASIFSTSFFLYNLKKIKKELTKQL
ncbi:MATE family efflux transporter [bacterium]|nr:MATE family efflux transporter [bacterium]